MTHTDPHTPETTTPAPAVVDLTALPGRVIDAVYLAAARAGMSFHSFHLYPRLGEGSILSVHLSDTGPRDLPAARAVFAHLGITDAAIDPRPGLNHSVVAARVPALNTLVEIVTDPIVDDPAQGDPAALLAVVDDARATAGVALTGPDGTAGVSA